MSELANAVEVMHHVARLRGAFSAVLEYADANLTSTFNVVCDGDRLLVEQTGDDEVTRLVAVGKRWLSVSGHRAYEGDSGWRRAAEGPWTPVIEKFLDTHQFLASTEMDLVGQGTVAGRETWVLRATSRDPEQQSGFEMMGMPGWYEGASEWRIEIDKTRGLLLRALPIAESLAGYRLEASHFATPAAIDKTLFSLEAPPGVPARHVRSGIVGTFASLARTEIHRAIDRVRWRRN